MQAVKYAVLLLLLIASCIDETRPFWFLESDDEETFSSGDEPDKFTESTLITHTEKPEKVIERTTITRTEEPEKATERTTISYTEEPDKVTKKTTIAHTEKPDKIIERTTSTHTEEPDKVTKKTTILHTEKPDKITKKIKITYTEEYDVKDICKEDILETREQKATVIMTAKVMGLKPDPDQSHLSIAKIQIKRVFKGPTIIAALDDERTKVKTIDSFNKVIFIYGIGEPSICKSSVKVGDTRIFMLNLEYFGNLRISSSIIPISSYNLDRTDAAVKDECDRMGDNLGFKCIKCDYACGLAEMIDYMIIRHHNSGSLL